MTDTPQLDQDRSVAAFAQDNAAYYQTEFEKIQGKTGFAW